MSLAALNTVLTGNDALWLTLAQSARAARARQDIWFWLIVLVVLAVLVIAAGVLAKKLFAGPIDSTEAEATFDLSELRRLHREGQLTDEEYHAARAIAIKDTTGYFGEATAPVEPADRPAPPVAPPPKAEPGADDVELGPELLGPDNGPAGPGRPDKPGRGPGPPDRTPFE